MENTPNPTSNTIIQLNQKKKKKVSMIHPKKLLLIYPHFQLLQTPEHQNFNIPIKNQENKSQIHPNTHTHKVEITPNVKLIKSPVI